MDGRSSWMLDLTVKYTTNILSVFQLLVLHAHKIRYLNSESVKTGLSLFVRLLFFSTLSLFVPSSPHSNVLTHVLTARSESPQHRGGRQ